MKLRESGMPAQAYWETLLDVPFILDAFGFIADSATGDIAELGCGYGTFTIPLAQRIRGTVRALDLDPAMFGLPAASCDAALLFNILHAEDPVALLRSARDVVRPGGFVAVIHWRSDLPTPRGPSLAIRPTPAQIVTWATAAGGLAAPAAPLSLPPWHYGLALRRI